MARPKLTEKEDKVITYYAKGISQREIAKKVGYSLGTVNKIIVNARKKTPDIENLRTFYQDLTKRKLGPPDIEHIKYLFEKLDNLNLTLYQLSQTYDFLEKTGYGKQTTQYIKLGTELKKLEDETGMTAQQLLKWYKQTTPKKKETEKNVVELTKQKEQLETEIQDLNKLKNIQTTLQKNGVTHQKLQSFLDTQKTLENLGFTKYTAHVLATELDKQNMNPENAANRVITYLTETQSLENKKNNLNTENTLLQQQKTLLKQEIIDSTNKLAKINDEIQTKIDSENTLIEKAVEDIKNKAKEVTEPLRLETAEKYDQIEKLNYQINKETEELRILETRKEELKEKYVLGEALIQILRDPESAALKHIQQLQSSTSKAIIYREKGLPNLTLQTTNEAKKVLTNILTEYAKKDLVPKYKYDDLQKREEQHKTYAEELNKKYEEQSQILSKNINEKENLKKSLGIQSIKLIKTQYNDAPIPVLKNIQEWIERIIREKSGQHVFNETILSGETLEWMNIQIKKTTETYNQQDPENIDTTEEPKHKLKLTKIDKNNKQNP